MPDLDLSTDLEDVVDNLEPITLAPRAWSSAETVTISKALRREVTRKDADNSNGKYRTDDTVWHFAASRGTPELGGLITDDDGTVWTILERSKQTLSNRWRCVCRLLGIDGGRETYLRIEKAAIVKGLSGAAERSGNWSMYRPSVRGVIAEGERTQQLRNGQWVSVVTGKLYLSENFALSADYRVVETANQGFVWRISGSMDRDQIDTLFSVTIEREE